MTAIQSALVVLVPEAEGLVKDFRDRYDPSASAGVPAHITLLYPFKRPNQISSEDLNRLGSCAASVSSFAFILATIRRFPNALYLAPEPDEPFRHLTAEIWRRYPETPPYDGKYPAIVPHLTVAQLADETQLNLVAAELSRALENKLPITARAYEMALLDTTSGRWEVRATFKLG